MHERAFYEQAAFHSTARDGSTAVLHDATHLQLDGEGKIVKAQFWLGHDTARA